MNNDTLTKISHVVFIITCIVLTSFAAIRMWGDTSARGGDPGPPIASDPVPPGSKAGEIEGVSFGNADLTVALVLNSQCRFCTASIPLYQKLSKLRRTGKVQLVALSLEPASVLDAYVQEHGLAVDVVTHLKGPEIQTPATPTLLLIDKSGTVDRSWLGQLSPQQEEELLKRIDAVAGPTL